VIQLSPPIETADVSAAEIHKPKPEKKEGLGVFAKILAGLLRKTGEKDAVSVSAREDAADGKIFSLTAKDSESAAAEELSALLPDLTGWAKGKKSGKTGAPEPGNAGGTRALDTKKRKPAGEISDGETPGNFIFEHVLPFSGPEKTAAEASGEEGTVPVNTGHPPRKNEGFSVQPGLEAAPARSGGETGIFAGTGPDGEAENGEIRAARKEKTGNKPHILSSSAEIEGSGQNRDTQGLPLSAVKKSGTPEDGNGEAGGRPAGSPHRDKRRDRINLEVRDLRTGDERNPASPPADLSSRQAAGEARPGGENSETEITLELRAENPGRETSDPVNSWETRSARSFEQTLARELHQNLNGDIVRHASMVLRDNGQGTIRLSLKPESLGNVKIRLEMAENKVTGHIVVESREALRAFEREAQSLEQAFKDSGFDGAAFDMSLTQGGGGTDRGWGEGADRPSAPEHLAALRYDAASERMEPPDFAVAEASRGVFTRNGRIAVNMLV
jgi:hypothetical protein